MTRTFSKIYGLAKLRIGWMYGPPHVIDAVNRVRGPFNMTGPAIAAGAAAMDDAPSSTRPSPTTRRWLPELTEALEALGLDGDAERRQFRADPLPRHRSGQDGGEADAYLSDRGCVLRSVAAYGLPGALRMSIGTEEANRAVIAELKAFLAA
jgi:histidinol-phosphate aminotransferase